MSDLKKEFEYYLDNKSNLLKAYAGKFIVIVNQEVIASYNDRIEAIEKTRETHELGTFLVQHVTNNGDENVRFHSRVAV